MKYLLALIILLTTATGCWRKRAPGPAPEVFLFSSDAEAAAALPWKDWSPAAFEEARKSGKPVFLSITRSLCPRCTVLDESTLSNERVGALLGAKFILVRVNADIYPEIANRFASAGLPRLAILNDKRDLLWDGSILQPTKLNQTLNAALRKELPVTLRAGVRQYDPNPARIPNASRLNRKYPYSFLSQMRFDFDNEFKGYGAAGKALSISGLDFDLKLGYVEWGLATARNRQDTHLNSVFAHLHDAKDGGFLTGTRDAGWNDFIPVKRADEQAAMAALLSVYSYWARHGLYFARDATSMSETAEATVAYLEQRLLDGGVVFAGEVGSRDYYRSEKRGSFAATQTNPVLQTSVTARVADGLAEAGHWAGNAEWVERGAQIATDELRHRKPDGLFWHVKNVTANRLEDATAMLGATLSLYTATADETWLTEATRIAHAMELLYSPDGFYLDVTAGSTGGTLFGEPMPQLNAATAHALLKLAIITNDAKWGHRAEAVAGQFAISPALLQHDEASLATLVWHLTQPLFRLEIPRAWRTQPAADRLIHPANTRLFIRWIDGSQGRVCHVNQCSLDFGEPEKLRQASLLALSTVKNPEKANLTNPFFK